MRKQPLNPFLIAEALIRAYPEEDKWETPVNASMDEFLIAVENVLTGKADPETLFERKFKPLRLQATRLKGMFPSFDEADRIFNERTKTFDNQALIKWHRRESSKLAHAIPISEIIGDDELISMGGLFGEGERQNNLIYKYVSPAPELEKHQEYFIYLLMDTAIERALKKMKQESQVHVSCEDGEIQYMGVVPIAMPADIPNFKANALQELRDLRTQLSELFDPIKGGGYRFSPNPSPKKVQATSGFTLMKTGVDTSQDFQPLIAAFLRYIDGSTGKSHMLYEKDGKNISADEFSAAVALNNAKQQYDDMITKFSQGPYKEQAEERTVEFITALGGMIPSQFEEALGSDYSRIAALAEAIRNNEIAQYVEITTRKEVKWLEEIFGLGKGRH